MINEDLKFIITDYNNQRITCDILSLRPKNENETYILYTDGDLDQDKNIIFKYGILYKSGEDFNIKSDVLDEELDIIKEQFHEDVLEFINEIKEGDIIDENI